MIDGKEGCLRCSVTSNTKDNRQASMAKVWIKDLPISPKFALSDPRLRDEKFPIEALSHAPLTAMMKTVKENKIKSNDVKEIKVEVIARAADILAIPHKYRPTQKKRPIIRSLMHGRRAGRWHGDAAANSKSSGCSINR